MFTQLGIGRLIVDHGKHCMNIGLDDRHSNEDWARH